jgi:Cof subfamily protein (haloacid dehalogenase superfamily)
MQKNNSINTHRKNHLPAIIALDLDGTLLRCDFSISPRTLQALQSCAKKGMKVIIATARPPRTISAMLPAGFPEGPWICYSGAEIYARGERIMQNALAPVLAKEIIKVIESCAPETTISFEMDDRLFINRPLDSPWIHTVVTDLVAVIDKPVAKVLFDTSNVNDSASLCAHLPGDCKIIAFNEGPIHLAEIVANEVSKVGALKLLVARAGHTMKEVIAFGDGDGDGDIEMLSQCGLGIAMGNASEAVKAAANWITASNDEDGVAVALEQLLGK